MSRKKITPPDPFEPAAYTVADVAAVQAVARGDATKDQQQRALNWIIYEAAKAYDLDYRPDSRDHAFASGKRFAGLQVVTMLKIDIGKLKQK